MKDYISYMRGMIGQKPMFLVGSGVILVDPDKRILLIKRTDNNMWGIPGGSMELGETFEETAKRELFEETGVEAKKLKLMDVFSGEAMRYTYPNGDEVYNAVCIYTCHEYEGVPHPDMVESRMADFFKRGSLPEDMHSPDISIIRKYFEKRDCCG